MSDQEATHADDVRVDVVRYPSGAVKAIPAGKGDDVVESFRNRGRSRAYLRKAALVALVLVVLAYSVLVLRNLVLGVLAGLLVYGVGAVLPRLTGSDAALLDAGVTLRDAREQWAATPVAAVQRDRDGDDERERTLEHAFEGEA